MNAYSFRTLSKPRCFGDREPLDNMTPAMKEIVAIRATARESVEAAREAMQVYTAIVIDTELLRYRNADLAKLIPLPMGQEDINEYVRAVYKAHQACYLVEAPRLIFYRMELLDIVRGCKGIKETFANMTALLKVSKKISVKQHAVQRRLRHPWCFVNLEREALAAHFSQEDELDWDNDNPLLNDPLQQDELNENQPDPTQSDDPIDP